MIRPDTLLCGDCLELMKDIPDNSVDMVLCDLPYGTTKNDWDNIIPLEDLWKLYSNVIKKETAIVLFSQQPFTSQLVISNPKMFKYEWIWEKDIATGFLNSHFAPLKIHENILVFSKKAACFVKDINDAMKFNPQMSTGKAYKTTQGTKSKNYDYKHLKNITTESDGKRYPSDIIKVNTEKHTFHPTQKPVALLRYLIRTYTDKGGGSAGQLHGKRKHMRGCGGGTPALYRH